MILTDFIINVIKDQELIMAVAVILGPIIAVIITLCHGSRKTNLERKCKIFRTLMANRRYKVDLHRIRALNMIDVEFANKKGVTAAWRKYYAHLCKYSDDDKWSKKEDKLIVELLHKMSSVLGYRISKERIKESAYAPQAHAEIVQQQDISNIKTIGAVADSKPEADRPTELSNKMALASSYGSSKKNIKDSEHARQANVDKQ